MHSSATARLGHMNKSLPSPLGWAHEPAAPLAVCSLKEPVAEFCESGKDLPSFFADLPASYWKMSRTAITQFSSKQARAKACN